MPAVGGAAGHPVRNRDLANRTIARYRREAGIRERAGLELPWEVKPPHPMPVEVARIPFLPVSVPGTTRF